LFRYKLPASPGENGCGTVDPGFSLDPRTGKRCVRSAIAVWRNGAANRSNKTRASVIAISK
jgi:hypothetical protein